MKWLKWSQKYNQWITYENLKDVLEMWNAYDKQYKHSKKARNKKR